jgi:D-alanyl-D-alanine carboxypeptidase
MKRPLCLILAAAVTATLQLTGCSSCPSGFNPEVQKRLEKAVQDNLKKYGGESPIPGALVGVWAPGNGTWVRGIGLSDLKAGREANIRDKVRVGSNTKTFVVGVILQLVDEGRLGLDDPISEFDLGLKIPNAGNITIRQLCNMTSGLFEAYESPQLEKVVTTPLSRMSPRELIKVAVKNPPYFPPGQGWHYTNTGYLILGLIIEAVTGNKVEDEIRKRLIDPLGLANTTFPTDYPGMPCPYMHGYDLDKNGQWTDVSIMYEPEMIWAAGAMISNVQDMKKWVKVYVTGKTNSPETQRERLECVDTKEMGAGFGLGIVCANGWYGYTGGIAGYNTAAYYLPQEDATIIVFVNAQASQPKPGVANSIVGDISRILFPDNVLW